jgi:hypothetical protein
MKNIDVQLGDLLGYIFARWFSLILWILRWLSN